VMAVPVKSGSTFAVGTPVVLFDTHERDGTPYDVRPDGQRFLIERALDERATLPMNICLNWLASMKK
jgi:hypothetical protein